MNTSIDDKHGPGISLHPPVIFAISILTGVGLNNFWPWAMPYGLQDHRYGIGLIAVAALLAIWARLEFYRADTDVRADTPDSTLLTSGPRHTGQHAADFRSLPVYPQPAVYRIDTCTTDRRGLAEQFMGVTAHHPVCGRYLAIRHCARGTLP